MSSGDSNDNGNNCNNEGNNDDSCYFNQDHINHYFQNHFYTIYLYRNCQIWIFDIFVFLPPPILKAVSDKYFSGDSYSQTGFNITDNLPYPSASNPIGNPAFPGYTTTNGDNWIDYLITQYNNTLMLSYNFAYGGATTSAALVTPYESTVLSLINQVSIFSSTIASKPSYAPWTSSNALFAIWIGVNDVGNAWGDSNWSTLAPEIIAAYISQVQILYNAGARNFLILTVPPIQDTPLVSAEGTATQTQEGAAVVTYNNLLESAISSFKGSNSGTTTYVLDTSVPFLTAINNPTAYGAPNNSCYNSDGVSCLWWNNYHPGQAIHKLVAAAIAALVGI
jgi:phospholipase/lecithinase/hemolysin